MDKPFCVSHQGHHYGGERGWCFQVTTRNLIKWVIVCGLFMLLLDLVALVHSSENMKETLSFEEAQEHAGAPKF